MKKKNMGHYFRRVLWISGRDVYQSIRRESGVSFEARAGAWTFLGLFLSALLQGKSGAFFSVDPVGAILVEGPFRSWQGWGAQGIVALGSGALGAILGIVVQNAWAFWSDLFPVLGRARRSWRIGVTVAFVLFMHGAFLLTDMTANPALYQEAFYQQGGILRGIQVFATDQCPIFLLMFYKTVVFLLIGFACLQVLKKVLLWYSHLSRPTRLAGVVLGFALLAAAVGVRGVLRFHAPKNEGPNILVIGVDSLRSDMLKISRGGGALTPNMNELVQSGRTYSYCIPPLADTAGPLMTLFTGRTPLTHGIRHSFSPGQDLSLGPTSLPALLKRRGYTTRVLTDFAGDFFSHLTKEFDQVQSADFHAVRQRRLQVLLRQVHVLPYLSGIWGRRFFPSLRNSLGLSDPSLLAEEAVPALRALRAREKFFFMVYFSALHDPYAAHSLDLYRDMGEYDGPCKYAMPLSRKRRSSLSPMDRVRARRLYEANVRAVDDAVGRILSALKRNRLADNTLVVLWSNHGEHLFEMGLGQGHGKHLKGMDVLAAPLVINEPRQRSAPKWVTEPVRTQDIAPTLLSLVGIPVPEDMEGFPLHQRDFSLPADEFFAAYSETGLWPSTDDGPGIPAERIPYPEVEEILEFDETEGRFRIGSRWEDHVLLAKHRMVQLGGERLVYIPTRQGVVYEYFNSGVDPAGIRNLAETADGAIRVKELKEVLFRALSREPGWRPQNGYWIPEAFWREE